MFVRPVLDFMQTMPSFVYLIPVIAFFGTGKPAGILATLVFGSPPVIRLTVLGLQNVPATVREATLAFGASPRFLLFKVDLPLAAPTIMAGVNQTIMLSLSMVVVASFIGAKGLGEDVMEALTLAAAGQGILAGLAVLSNDPRPDHSRQKERLKFAIKFLFVDADWVFVKSSIP